MKRDYLDRLFNLKEKTVLVTGATGQLGNEICRAYLDVGSNVIGADSRLDKKRMHKSRSIEYVHMDIADRRSVSDVFRYIYSEYGALDILINNAGVSIFEPFEERTEEQFDWVMDVNLKGTFFCIQTYAQFAGECWFHLSLNRSAHIESLLGVDVMKTFPLGARSSIERSRYVFG